MILVTGATGFVGRAVVPRLVESGAEVRCLVRPSAASPRLPRGVPVQVTVADMTDFRGMRAALVGVDTVIHLAGTGWRGPHRKLIAAEYEGTRTLLEAATEAGLRRILYLSHLGADRASAYGVHKVKGLVEEFIRRSGIAYTIVRSAVLYGAEDVFTNGIATMLKAVPGIFLLPGDGQVQLQPLWIEDLATCVEWGLEDPTTLNQTISIGGPEFLTFAQIVQLIMRRVGVRRTLVPVPRPYLRIGAQVVERLVPRAPLSPVWLDHLAVSRIHELQSVTRYFGLKPARFEHSVDYLADRDWRKELGRILRGREAAEGT